MKKRLNLAVTFLSALIFTFLFFKQSLGINLLIYEFAVLTWLYFTEQFKLNNRNTIIVFLSVLSTCFFTVLHHSTLSFVVNFFTFFVFIGVVISPEIKSLLNSIQTSFTNLFTSISELKQRISGNKLNSKKFRFTLMRSRIFFIPILIILLFSAIYSWANPEFGKILNRLWSSISETISSILEIVDISIIITFVIGLIIGTSIFLRRKNEYTLKRDLESNESLIRIRQNYKHEGNFRIIGLKNEYRSALFLFASLNILLFGMNLLDFDHVWLNFEFEGQYLKQFVHQGTYVLLFAIIISIFLVLYFFRSNLNFYTKNKSLKVLCYIWIIQNAILVLSVGIRNWYYIQYFALAYKRIAVVFFLLLALYGLFSVFIKVKNAKSKYYLTKNNAFVWLVVLVISSGFNWDHIIARYNFENSKKSFVHLNYLSQLSNSSLPYLDRPKSELEKIDIYQESEFTFKFSSESNYRGIYMDVNEYLSIIHYREDKFKREWESKGILEWNYAEYNAYNELIEMKNN